MAELVPTIAWDGLALSDSLWRRRPTEPRVEFFGRALDPQGRSVAGATVRLQLGASSAPPTRTIKVSSA